jgi:serine/threonine protein kinase
MNREHLCMGCMGDKGDAQVCGVCGWAEGTPPDVPVQLSPRSVLAEKYLLGKVLGQGGFGITYLAWDLLLNRKLAIKEYFPREICGRGRDDLSVQPLSQRSQHDYQYGLAKFVEEGRNLAKFRDYPGIVSLLDFFEANGTAYIVMAYMEGMTFKQYLEQQGGKITFEQTLGVLNPVMDALREVHRTGMLHRDISPDNIYLNRDRQVKILDFGATRYAMREQSQNLTVLIKPGYAPLEQYSSGGKQGPWTDVYAVGATFYRALSGRAPSEAPDRLAQDDLVPPSKLNISIPPESESALLKSLTVQWQSRFQSIDDFQRSVTPKENDPGVLVSPSPPSALNRALLAVAGLLLLSTLAFSALWLSARGQLKLAETKVEDLTQQLQGGQNKIPDSGLPDDLKKQVADLTAQRDDLQNKLQASVANLNAAQGEEDSLKKEVASLTQQVNRPSLPRAGQTQPPPVVPPPSVPKLSIAYFSIYNSDREGSGKVGPSDHFSSSALRYVLCQLGGPNPLRGRQPLSRALEVRFFGPGGGLRRIVSQQATATQTQVLWTSQAVWGNDQPGTFQPGLWRIEVWDGASKIGEKTFQVN